MTQYLENNQLLFRSPEPEDLDILYKWENDTTLWQYSGVIKPFSRMQLRQYLESINKDIYSTHQIRYMIDLKEKKETIGSIDLFDFDPFHQRAAIGIIIDSKFQGKGFAQEAITILTDYCFHYLHLHQVYATIEKNNIPCLKAFKKNNFIKTGEMKEWLYQNDHYCDVLFVQKINPLKKGL